VIREDPLSESQVMDVVAFVRALERDPALTSAQCPSPPTGAPAAGVGGAHPHTPDAGTMLPTGQADAGQDGGTTPGTDASTLVDAGAPDAALDAGTDAHTADPKCSAWCDCLAMHCADYSDYPFSTVAECHADCATHTDAELSCWTNFCEEIPTMSTGLRRHLCEHGWGALDLDEC
jgi:hypothetical protein